MPKFCAGSDGDVVGVERQRRVARVRLERRTVGAHEVDEGIRLDQRVAAADRDDPLAGRTSDLDGERPDATGRHRRSARTPPAPSDSTNCNAVMPAVGNAAATAGSRSSGNGANAFPAGTVTYSAYVPTPTGRCAKVPKILSPEPTTSPAPSVPGTNGNTCGAESRSIPLTTLRSYGFTLAANNRTLSSFGPGSGSGSSTTSSSAPKSGAAIAHMPTPKRVTDVTCWIKESQYCRSTKEPLSRFRERGSIYLSYGQGGS